MNDPEPELLFRTRRQIIKPFRPCPRHKVCLMETNSGAHQLLAAIVVVNDQSDEGLPTCEELRVISDFFQRGRGKLGEHDFTIPLSCDSV